MAYSDQDKSIASKWLTAGGIHEDSWDTDKGQYMVGVSVAQIFVSLLTEEECSTGFASVVHQFSRWSNDLDITCEQIIGKDAASKIYANRGLAYKFDAELFERNMKIMIPGYGENIASKMSAFQ